MAHWSTPPNPNDFVGEDDSVKAELWSHDSISQQLTAAGEKKWPFVFAPWLPLCLYGSHTTHEVSGICEQC